MNRRPSLLFYCQHSLGMGHLVRSLALAAALRERFRVVLLNGGRLPRGVVAPEGVEVINLPPVGMGGDGQLASRDGRRTVERAMALRRRLIIETYANLRPRVVLVELFPFGRKKFAGELLPLLEAARAESAPRPLVVCSLRDILVGRRSDQRKHDERAVEIANRHFDAVLVHSDPRFARLEESLGSFDALRVPVRYTGFVMPEARSTRAGSKLADSTPRSVVRAAQLRGRAPSSSEQILVSAGGGLVGEPLLRAAVEAFARLRRDAGTELTKGLSMKIVTGPFLPEDAWRRLRESAAGVQGLCVRRFVPDLCAEMRRSAATVSQCGYNTALDILRAATPALVVPFSEGGEDEQLRRARRLERLGALRVLEADELDDERFARALRALLEFRPRALELDLDGARNTVREIESLLGSRAGATGRARRRVGARKEAAL